MPDRPNILWFMTDEQRADSLRVGGAPWAVSPHLDSLAARGTRFAAAYTPSPVCVAARAALLTGKANARLGVLNNHQPLPDEHARFLPESFAAAGYRTASFGKHHYNHRRPAFQTQGGSVLDERVGYNGYRVEVDAAAMGAVQYPSEFRPWLLAGRFPGGADDTAEMRNVALALDWLREADRRPFLLRVSVNAPHTPTVAPAPFDTLIDPEAIDLPIDWQPPIGAPSPVGEHLTQVAGVAPLTPEQVARTRQVYYGRCAFVDEVFGRLLAEVDSLGLLDDTIVVFCSDHGTHLGDHGFYQKQSFYDASARVPLLLAGPGVAAGHTVDTPVNLGGLLPTLGELCGVGLPPADFASLAAACAGEPLPSAPVFSEIDYGIWDWRSGDRYIMVRQGDWKLALFRDPADPARFVDDGVMLHNLADDPGERRNLAGDPAQAERIAAMIEAIDRRDAGLLGAGGASTG